jgi:uncharacterized membrane protein
MIDSEVALLGEDQRDRALRRNRQVIGFGLGLGLLFILATWLPDLLPTQAAGLVSGRVHALITSIEPAAQDAPPTATVRILEGIYATQGGPATLEGPSGQLELPDYRVGDEVVVAIDTNPDGTQTLSVIDRWRLPLLQVLLGAFALLTIAVAGWRGLRALTSLAITLLIVVRILIPLLLAGWSPVPLAIVLGVAITILSFLLTQGVGRATFAAILGTAAGLAVTGVLAALVSQLARFTPSQGSQELIALEQIGAGRIDLSGLLLAAVIFGGLGVLNDVAISQAVTVDELREVDPGLGRRELYSRTMRIGVAHLAANVNTLVFAYLGAGLPLLVLLAVQVGNLTLAANEEFIAVEVVRAVVGAIGVLAAVPLTTALAALLAGPPRVGDEFAPIGEWLDPGAADEAGLGQPG